MVALPLLTGEAVVGGLVFGAGRAERAWEQEGLLQGLQIVGEVFANALARTRGDQEMQRLRQELAHELNQPLTAGGPPMPPGDMY